MPFQIPDDVPLDGFDARSLKTGGITVEDVNDEPERHC